MQDGYYNYYTRFADSWWERRDFVRGWRRLHAGDRRWVPPYFPALNTALNPERSAHVDRQHPALFWIEALQGQPNTSGTWNAHRYHNVFMEQAVAVTALLADPRRNDGTATMALLSVANDVESLERLLGVAQEQAYGRGRSRLIGPTALSPHLGYGVLLDHFDKTPPLNTPYNPPYLAEIMDSVFTRVQRARLFHVETRASVTRVDGPAVLRPLSEADDAKVLPYLLTALDDNVEFPRPDAAEAAFLLAWWGVAPRSGWVAEVEGQPVGFVLLQPDLAVALRQTKGARMPWWRVWWQWRRTWRAGAGRVVSGGVLPRWRRQGIGRQLWAATMESAQQQGWRTLSIGPVPDDSAAAAFLRAHEATPLQRYALYGTD